MTALAEDCLPPHKRVAQIRQQPYDANGLPYGFSEAKWAAAKALVEFVNELPESIYHLNAADAELATDRMLNAYRHSLACSLQQLWDRR